jgi:propanediol dehydratase small subunit
MANNKNKRSIQLAQTQPQHAKIARAGDPETQRRRLNPQPAAEQMPVKAAIYRTMAELNAGFEKVARDFKELQQVGYFPAGRLLPLYNLLGRIRAQANRECLAVMNQRELANQEYFDQMYSDTQQQALKNASASA